MQLYVISCDFMLEQNGDTHHGVAICSDPDTPITFIYADGKPYVGTEVWTYKLRHYQPWAVLETSETSDSTIR